MTYNKAKATVQVSTMVYYELAQGRITGDMFLGAICLHDFVFRN